MALNRLKYFKAVHISIGYSVIPIAIPPSCAVN
jgi:hypothetical protein